MLDYKPTIRACFVGYTVQAIINNFVPLLFTTFMAAYGLSLGRISLLVTFNFGVQLLVDLLAGLFADRIGHRRCMILAHVFCCAGLAGLSFLPDLLPVPFAGVLLCVTVYALGGGLLEVLVSPIVEHCPTDNKAGTMSLLHSYYCWGTAAVVLLSTLFFTVCGVAHWRILALLWSLVPLGNAAAFCRVPVPDLPAAEEGAGLRRLTTLRLLPAVLLLMFCAGASEQAVSQWASAFTESALGVDKTTGDLLGTTLFSVLMGSARLFYGKKSEKIPLQTYMALSAALCCGSYLLISLAPNPALGLIGCGLCGLSVGVFWPGTTSLAAASIPTGGTVMFAFMALAGDLGCAAGPTFVGLVGDRTGGLPKGVLAAVCFPVLLLAGLFLFRKMTKEKKGSQC